MRKVFPFQRAGLVDPNQKLFDALAEFMNDRGYVLATGPMDNLILPIEGGGTLEIPLALLASQAIDQITKRLVDDIEFPHAQPLPPVSQ